MKLTKISLALASTFAMSHAFAATVVDQCDDLNASTKAAARTTMAQSCVPEVVFHLSGASAPKAALDAVLPTLFDTNATTGAPLQKLGAGTASWAGDYTGYYGYGGPAMGNAAGKRVYIAYRVTDGSASGVRQVLTADKVPTLEKEPNSVVIIPGPGKGCTLTAPSATATLRTYSCDSAFAKPVESVLAISDVLPFELSHSFFRAQVENKGKLPGLGRDKLVTTPLALQGFGVWVNTKLYQSLQERSVARGELPSSCASAPSAYVLQTTNSLGAYSVTAAMCRPSISSAEYAALVSTAGASKVADALPGLTSSFAAISDTAKITVFRRVDSSGTQAASNMFFLRQNCQGYGLNAAGTGEATDPVTAGSITKAGAYVKNTFGGALVPRSGAPVSDGGVGKGYPDTTNGPIFVKEGSTSGEVRLGLRNETNDYAIGVVSLDSIWNTGNFVTGDAGSTAKPVVHLVRIDGNDPMLANDGTVDEHARVAVAQGRWPFSFELQAVSKPDAKIPLQVNKDVRTAIVNSIATKSGPHTPLVGVTYLRNMGTVLGATAATALSNLGTKTFTNDANGVPKFDTNLVANFKRAGGNNCAPFVPTRFNAEGLASN
jgi:hypothetical protein